MQPGDANLFNIFEMFSGNKEVQLGSGSAGVDQCNDRQNHSFETWTALLSLTSVLATFAGTSAGTHTHVWEARLNFTVQ
jgi:hypothetical protein